MKETLSIGGKDEFKVIEVPSPFPPGIKTEIKKIMDERHMSDKEKHRLLISMANDLDKSIKWNDAENHLVDDVEELKRVALYGKIFMCIVCLFIVKLIFLVTKSRRQKNERALFSGNRYYRRWFR